MFKFVKLTKSVFFFRCKAKLSVRLIKTNPRYSVVGFTLFNVDFREVSRTLEMTLKSPGYVKEPQTYFGFGKE